MSTKLTLKLLIICLGMTMLFCLYLINLLFVDSSAINSKPQSLPVTYRKHHRLAVIVPFRDRFSELLLFVPHIHRFLSEQDIPHTINIINQNDSLRFNRASLINAGYLLTKDDCDYIAMHDVDLLPLNPALRYDYPQEGPRHLASPDLHPKYHYKTFVGGILLITGEDFEKVNGLSNKYWGWGQEDDEFYLRLKEAKLPITRPSGITTGTANTFLHVHDNTMRKRDYARPFNQKEVTRRRDRETGLDNVNFEVISRNNMLIDDAPCNIFNVKLICDHKLTPWCDFSLVNKNKTKTRKSK